MFSRLVEGRRYLGVVSVRHRLTRSLRVFGGHIGYAIRPSERRKGYGRRILKLVLPKARKLGLKRVLVTCSPRNLASRKVIEGNGGVFAGRVKSKQGVRLTYWISLW